MSSLTTSNSHTSPNFIQLTTKSLSTFTPITLSELTKIINSMPSTICSLDFIPTTLLKEFSNIFFPIFLHLVNLSLLTSKFPTDFKTSTIIPLLKNSSLDSSFLSNSVLYL